MLGSAYRRMSGVLKRHLDVSYNQYRTGFIVLLPEVDPDVADRLLSMNDELPVFSKITKEKIGTIMGKHIVDFECMVRNADRELEETPQLYPDLFEDVLNPLEKTIHSFDTVVGIAKTFYLVDKNVIPPVTFYGIGSRMQSARATLYITEAIFEACKKVDKNKLTEEQARYVDKLLFEGRMNGLEAAPKKRALNNYRSNQISKKQTEFKVRVDAAKSQFFFTIDDPLMVQEVPRYLLKKMSHIGGGSVDGPWTVKLYYGIGEKFMEYCPDRDTRFMIWHAEDKAASLAESSRELVNSLCLEEIRAYRHEVAETAGFKNYYEAMMGSKMAGPLENVTNALDSWLQVAKPAQFDEITKLQEFADLNDFTSPIQLWDISYWARRQKRAEFNFDDELLRNYMPLERVLSGLFSLCTRLFGIRVEEVKTFDSWHPEVRFFYIYEPDFDKPVAGFYLDPYYRAAKMQATAETVRFNIIRNASRVPRPIMPLTSFIMNFEPPDEKHPCLLSFSEAHSLFFQFGHGLQCLLNKSSYTEVSGTNFMEWDAVGTCGKFLANWLYEKDTFESVTTHYLTGDKCPTIDLDGVKKHLAGFKLCNEMFKARVDLGMHTINNQFWHDIATDLWDDHYIFPLSKYFSDPCRYEDIFGDNWGAAYYSHLWSDMLAADIHLAFKEENDEASVGARFRDTFLTFGGSCHASEVFRRFMGRDPDPQALLQSLGLADGPKTVTEGSGSKVDPIVVSC